MNFGLLTNGIHSAFPSEIIGDFIAQGILNFSQNFIDEINTTTRFTMYFEWITSTSVTNLKIIKVNGATAILNYAADVGALDHLKNKDYLHISNFVTQTNNNGLWKLITTPSANAFKAIKVDHIDPVIEDIGEPALCNENPFESPGAIIVENYNKEDINELILSNQIPFDFDYSYNNQGGRYKDNDVPVIISAIACDGAQYIKVKHTITKSIGQVISIDAVEELNFTD